MADEETVRCLCDAGFESPAGYPAECSDIDECATNNGECDPLTSCSNFSGGHTCGSCPGGYTGTGETGCVDIDECVAGNGGCDLLTACTNTPGGRTCGACPPGYDGTGETGCTPRACEGAPTSDCACLKVTLDGDDAAAVASHGLTAFATVQAAIDFAGANPGIASNVCVAGGAACGSTGRYRSAGDRDLQMSDGVSVYGGYESSTWTRCTTTTLKLGTPAGIVFGADVQTPTTLDGFAVEPFVADTTAGISVRGAQGVRLVSLALLPTDPFYGFPGTITGIAATDGADLVLSASSMELLTDTGTAEGLRVTNARVTASSLTVAISSDGAYGVPGATLRGIVLSSAPGSKVEGAVEVLNVGDDDEPATLVNGAYVTGDASGTELDVGVTAENNRGEAIGVWLEDCAGAMPLVSGSGHVSSRGTAAATPPLEGLRSLGDCHPRIVDFSGSVSGVNVSGATGIRCGLKGGVPSRCSIISSGAGVSAPRTQPSATITHTKGIHCEAGACAEIRESYVRGFSGADPSCARSCHYYAYGIDIEGSDTFVARNSVEGGCADRAIGISGGGRIENNLVVGRSASCLEVVPDVFDWSYGIYGGGDVHSNNVSTSGATLAVGPCSALAVSAAGSVRNNIIVASGGCSPTAVSGGNVTNNLLSAPYLAGGISDIDVLNSLDAYEDNITGSCAFHLEPGSPCIDAGTTAGAPLDDYDGEPRSGHPDIGADEWGDLPCASVDCSGHGTCLNAGSQAVCDCDSGYVQRDGDPTKCDPFDE